MANVVLGVGTVHTPLCVLPPELWESYARGDHMNPELVFPPDGVAASFEEALETIVPADIQNRPRSIEIFKRQYEVAQQSLDSLAKSLRDANPDVVVIVSDDQDEWFYEDNMPSLSIYWGDTVPLIPRPMGPARDDKAAEIMRLVGIGYTGEQRRDVPVQSDLGRYLIMHLIESGFDISHMTYLRDSYSGVVRRRYPRVDGTPLDLDRTSPPRQMGLPHGFSFVVNRLLDGMDIPILPIMQNTCYPPNNVTPARCHSFGETLADGLAEWDGGRVAVVASGGLSHFVVDEVIDRAILDALVTGDKEAMVSLPRHRLRSATSESLNWVTVGALMSRLGHKMELLSYEPVYRTEAGTGAGMAFGKWSTET